MSHSKKSTSNQQQLFSMQISKEALQDNDTPDDSLTEEDLKVCVSPVSPVFHAIETVIFSLNSIGNKHTQFR